VTIFNNPGKNYKNKPTRSVRLVVSSCSWVSDGHQDVSDSGASSGWWGNGAYCGTGDWGGTTSERVGRYSADISCGGFDGDVGRVDVGCSWFVGADVGSESTFVGDVVYNPGVAFQVVDGVGTLNATSTVSGFLVGASATVFSVGSVVEGVWDGDVLGWSILSNSCRYENSENDEDLHCGED